MAESCQPYNSMCQRRRIRHLKIASDAVMLLANKGIWTDRLYWYTGDTLPRMLIVVRVVGLVNERLVGLNKLKFELIKLN